MSLVLAGAVCVPGCALDRAGVAGGENQLDASIARDARTEDAPLDAPAPDAASDAGPDAAAPDACVMVEESCDGRDQDCDGRVDEGLEACGECDVLLREAGATYLFCDAALEYDAAREACRALGYDLAVIDDPAENDVLRMEGNRRRSAYRVGLDDRASEGTFVWVDGSVAWSQGASVGYANWLVAQPDDFLGEDCVELRRDGTWNDTLCVASRYICESLPRP